MPMRRSSRLRKHGATSMIGFSHNASPWMLQTTGKGPLKRELMEYLHDLSRFMRACLHPLVHIIQDFILNNTLCDNYPTSSQSSPSPLRILLRIAAPNPSAA
jgi:hypothetical protein